jgi:uncharacterized membrane protein
MATATFDITAWIARIIVALIFIGMGLNHFRGKPRHMMGKMIPPALRREGALRPDNLVLLTGLCELAGGIGVLIPFTRFAAGIGLVAFLIAVWPANRYASEHPETFGSAATPFWPRYALQLVFIVLIVYATFPLGLIRS